jgi:hypothetical protein
MHSDHQSKSVPKETHFCLLPVFLVVSPLFASPLLAVIQPNYSTSSTMSLVHDFVVDSPCVTYTEEFIYSDYTYSYTKVKQESTGTVVIPVERRYKFQVRRKVPKLGYVFRRRITSCDCSAFSCHLIWQMFFAFLFLQTISEFLIRLSKLQKVSFLNYLIF